MGHALQNKGKRSVRAGVKHKTRTLRVTDSQWRSWKDAAAQCGIPLAEWIRTSCEQRKRRDRERE